MTRVLLNNRPVTRPLDNIFNDFFNMPSLWSTPADVAANPAANIYETPVAFYLELNAPGRNKEDFKINLEKDLLTISYDKKDEKQPDDVTIIRQEFSAKEFRRSFHLDEKIDVTNISAKYENGILRVELPKKEEVKQQPKQITVS